MRRGLEVVFGGFSEPLITAIMTLIFLNIRLMDDLISFVKNRLNYTKQNSICSALDSGNALSDR